MSVDEGDEYSSLLVGGAPQMPGDDAHHAEANNNGVVHVGTPTLLLSAFPLLCIAFVGHKFGMGMENALIVGIIRSFVQLMVLGLILHPIFLMGMDWPGLVGLCECASAILPAPKTVE